VWRRLPKLDDAQFYIDKLATILSTNKCRSLTVIHMEVPCCSGLTRIAKEAIRRSGTALKPVRTLRSAFKATS